MSPALLSLTPEQLAALLEGSGRAKDVYALLRRGIDPFAPGELAPSAYRRLVASTRPTKMAMREAARSTDGTRKLLCTLHDGRAVEAVLIPNPDRTTLCISSQVGCRRGCTFCLTGTMGLVRHLDADEIVAQVLGARRLADGLPPVRNLVFMGMGEPLDNPKAVGQTLSILCGPGGLGFGPKHITVSTVGPSPAAIKSARHFVGRLAWSLHAADEKLRAELVPTTRFSPELLRDAFAEILEGRGHALFVELTLLDGVNDSPDDARKAAALFKEFSSEVRFNLLPMNPIPGSQLAPSPDERVEAFSAVLQDAGYLVKRREARGQDGKAACGQLAVLGS